MYVPQHFREPDRDAATAVMRDYPFATVITQDGHQEPYVSHLPILHEPDGEGPGRLIGHMARANEQWRHMTAGQSVLMIFHGPHRYVSPSWYVTPVNVPTWNYVAVHARGRASVEHSPAKLMEILQKTITRFEAGSANPWKLEAPPEYLSVRLPMIVGFEMAIESIEAKFKLNQNRPDVDRRAVIARLREETDPTSLAMFELMQKLDE